jgi:hypothetical protein
MTREQYFHTPHVKVRANASHRESFGISAISSGENPPHLEVLLTVAITHPSTSLSRYI